MVVLPFISDSQLIATCFQSTSGPFRDNLVQAVTYCICPEEGGKFSLYVLTANIF